MSGAGSAVLTRRPPRHLRRLLPTPELRQLLPGVLVLAAAGAGASLNTSMRLALLPLGLLVVVALAQSPMARLAFVVLGGLAVLGSSQELSYAKLLYLAGLCWVMLAAVASALRSDNRSPVLSTLLPFVLISTVMIACSGVVALLQGIPFVDWVRSVTPYLLLVMSPLLAQDAGGRVPPRHIEWLLVTAGVISALSFAISQLAKRGQSGLELTHLAFANFPLCAAVFVYALARASAGPYRLRWLTLALSVLAALLVTGTVTNLTMLVGTTVIGAGLTRSQRLLRAVGVGVGLAVVSLALLPLLASAMGADRDFLMDRYGPQRLGNVTADHSFQERRMQYRVALDTWEEDPWLGAGPGHVFTYSLPFTPYKATPSLDTPLALPAKFGAAGLVLTLAGAIAVRRAYRTVAVRRPHDPWVTTCRGTAFVLLALTPFGATLEDKGLALAAVLLLAGLIARSTDLGDDAAAALDPPGR
ncbi:MAG: hypothetical protein M3P91_09165 [Actinomycetota bacterium]|nr:hypothetical protein [Actinomycetota bacterium]